VLYSSGGALRSVPGSRRSTRRGDCPEDTLEGPVAFLFLDLMLFEPCVLCEPAREPEPGANEFAGDVA
jgi:hypothetical protein